MRGACPGVLFVYRRRRRPAIGTPLIKHIDAAAPSAADTCFQYCDGQISVALRWMACRFSPKTSLVDGHSLYGQGAPARCVYAAVSRCRASAYLAAVRSMMSLG